VAIEDAQTESLLNRAEAGDGPAVERLLSLHRDRLRRMIGVRMDPRLAARIDPSDVIQEAAIEVARRLPEYLKRRDCAFYPWLRRIAWERLVWLHRQHVEARRRLSRGQMRRREWQPAGCRLQWTALPPPESRVHRMHEVTRILSAIEQGDPQAADKLLPLVYDELRRLAAEKMAQEKPGQTLQATALVHEAYIRLVDTDKAQHWNSRGHFFGAAAEAMRRILVDNARRKASPMHGGDRRRVELKDMSSATEVPAEDLLSVDEALARLAQMNPSKAELVRLRFYAGMSVPEAAKVLGVSVATAERYWTYARSWLYCELNRGEEAQDKT